MTAVAHVTTNLAGSNTTTYTYVYDSMQNWTAKTQVKDGVKAVNRKKND